ncbi:amidohydrolase family protein [Ihubacter sp. mB4P-1]|uniref:N-acyl-D-amino-acid deacylase family protein n=1 Tax=Ihubacter sp. mB4P-1 TaxID=3242370 RepID=UPI003C7D54A6
MFDVLIENGLVCDGTGKPFYMADIGITGDQITYIGNHQAAGDGNTPAAKKVIDAAGKVVTPGFIDPHTHVDLSVLSAPEMEPYLKQGVTTVVTGNCGYSLAPQGKETLYYAERDLTFLEEAGAADEDMNPLIFEKERGARALKERLGVDLDWQTFSEFAEKCARLPLGCNMAPLAGHSAIRTAVMGVDCQRAATEAEICAMEQEVRLAMEAGAFGMSTGRDPIYLPGPFAEDKEITRLLRRVSAYDGIFASHTYNYDGNGASDRMGGYAEMFRQADGLPLKVHVSHVHVMGMAENPAQAVQAAQKTLDYFARMRGEGLNLTYDVIPDPACADFTQVSFGYYIKPLVKLAGTRARLAEMLKEPAFRETVHAMIADGQLPALDACGETCWLPEFSILEHKNPAYQGRGIPDIAEEMGLEMADAMMHLFAEDPDMAADLVAPDFGEAVDLLCMDACAMPCSDGSSYAKETNLTGDAEMPLYPNSMNLSYIPRYLNRYGAGDDRVFAEAVRKASGFVAERFAIKGRGVIREGNFADLVILDRGNLHSFDEDANPLQDPLGIDYVLVNGQMAVEKGRFAGGGAGRVLRKGAY